MASIAINCSRKAMRVKAFTRVIQRVVLQGSNRLLNGEVHGAREILHQYEIRAWPI